MTDYLYLDIETRSGADLKKTGVYRYAEDDDFAIILMAWAWNDDEMQTTSDPDVMTRVITEAINHTDTS